jgi:hypothetical protein
MSVATFRALDGPRGPMLAGGIAFVTYASTLTTSLAGGDAGELVTAARHLEVAHPPGYPLYTLLGYLFTLLPVTPHLALSWLSACCEAGAVAGVMVLARSLTTNSWLGLATALTFGVMPVVWEWAIAPEVFALHHLLLVLFLIALERGSRSLTTRRVATAGVLAGLAVSHHQTALFVIVPALVLLVRLPAPAGVARSRLVATAVAAGAVGCLPLLALVPLTQGATTLAMGDPSTVDGFLRHVLRADYGTFQLAGDQTTTTSGTLRSRLTLFGHLTAEALLWAGVPFAALAVAPWPSGDGEPTHRNAFLRTLIAALALYVLVFGALANLPTDPPLFAGVLARFVPQAAILALLLAACGGARAVARWPRGARLVPAVVVVPVLAGVLRLSDVTTQHGPEIERYGRVLLDALPEGAVLLTRGDLPTNAVRYLQHGLGHRADVIHLDQELLTRDWYVRRAGEEHRLALPGRRYGPEPDGFLLADLLSAVAPRPVAIYPEVKPGDTSLQQRGFVLVPEGWVQHVRASVSVSDLEHVRTSAERVTVFPSPANLPPTSWRRVVADDAVAALHRSGTFLLTQALSSSDGRAALEDAAALLERAADRVAHDPPWWLSKNLGLVYAQRAGTDDDARRRTLRWWRQYLNAAPDDEKDRVAIRAAIDQFMALGDLPTSGQDDR